MICELAHMYEVLFMITTICFNETFTKWNANEEKVNKSEGTN
jgi:hypothetical protein